MHELHFGQIRSLLVRGGEPVLDAQTLVCLGFKFGHGNLGSPSALGDDFALKPQVLQLLSAMTVLRDGRIDLIEVQDGLPHRMLVLDQPVI